MAKIRIRKRKVRAKRIETLDASGPRDSESTLGAALRFFLESRALLMRVHPWTLPALIIRSTNQ
jgi:hypothetical protein